MNVTGPVQVVLHMETTADTITGHIAVEGGPASGFFGWLELIDRLERAAAGQNQELPATTGRSGSSASADGPRAVERVANEGV